uniref:Uncharacterized protein n=1 Tax=Scophthalmus maximus TaxID=52904 RepID=A0A8D3DFB1_SCOMX
AVVLATRQHNIPLYSHEVRSLQRECVSAAPGSPQCLWTGTDDLRRRFVAGLLLRCTSVRLLEHIQRMLDVTSWSLFAYARTRSAARPRGRPRPRPRSSLPQEEPRGAGLTEIWGWFSGSPHWVKSHYLSRVFSRCDPELLHMAFNLAGVLLVRENEKPQFCVRSQPLPRLRRLPAC